MARIRSIKPEFWTSEQVMECSPTTRLLFIGIWNFCDDEGRHPLAPKQIKALVFPGDDLTVENVRGMLDELSRVGLIHIYVVDDREYFSVTGWHHQKIDKPQKSKFPPPPPPGLDHSPNVRRTFATEGKGEERKGSNSEPNGSGAKAPPPVDQKTDLFRRAREVLGPNSGGLVVSLLRANGGEDNPSAIPKSRSTIEMAAARTNGDKKRAAEYVGRVLSPKPSDDGPSSAII